jgi:hypothetical protein
MPEDATLVTPPERLAEPELLGASRRGMAASAATALLLGLGAFGFAGSDPVTKGDHISNTVAVNLAEGFRRANGTLLPVDVSTKPQREKLLQSLPVPAIEAERLIALVERGERMLGWLTLWDNFDEDGDVVSVTAAGFTQSVALMHAPTRILVPYIPGQPVFITGERDGMGGGVTVAVHLSTGPLPLPPLAVGQTVALPIQ